MAYWDIQLKRTTIATITIHGVEGTDLQDAQRKLWDNLALIHYDPEDIEEMADDPWKEDDATISIVDECRHGAPDHP